ncbi:RING FINGER CONTAINING PROTEIN [Ceraceosorus bombacis]|uniref:RING FINGER CONTAINING PROTEIN n=1 Tax=Ceraceosorus bombacis TaxID=401625 RepID=A0A0P1BJL7_9BASI|nr:RING FINGER CONTAINING PROTEIN [Ceraceosorus bombacis]
MPCNICLNEYKETDPPTDQPVALKCGHIFHRACIEQWCALPSGSGQGGRKQCCACKSLFHPSEMVTLYVDRVEDLAPYLARRNTLRTIRAEARFKRQKGMLPTADEVVSLDDEAAPVLECVMDEEEQDELLGCLIDWKDACTSYLMAINEVRITRANNESMLMAKLIKDAGASEEAQRDLKRGLQSLNQVAAMFNSKLTLVHESQAHYEEERSRLSTMLENLDRQALEIKKRRTEVERQESGLKTKSAAIKESARSHKADLEQEEKRLTKKREELVFEEAAIRKQAADVQMMKINAMQEIAVHKAKADHEVGEMRKATSCMQDEVAEVKAEMQRAEQERNATRAKSEYIAGSIASFKTAAAKAKKQREEDRVKYEQRIQNLESTVKKLKAEVRAAHHRAEHGGTPSNRSCTCQQKSSPISTFKGPTRASEEGSQRSSDAEISYPATRAILSEMGSSLNGRSVPRPSHSFDQSTSLSLEVVPEDITAELSDEDYHFFGLGKRSRPEPVKKRTADTAVGPPAISSKRPSLVLQSTIAVSEGADALAPRSTKDGKTRARSGPNVLKRMAALNEDDDGFLPESKGSTLTSEGSPHPSSLKPKSEAALKRSGLDPQHVKSPNGRSQSDFFSPRSTTVSAWATFGKDDDLALRAIRGGKAVSGPRNKSKLR